METSAWLVVLSSGFAYSITCLPALYTSARETGHRLYFRAAIYAVFMLIISLLAFVRVALSFNLELPITRLHLLPTTLLASQWAVTIQVATLPAAFIVACLVNAPFYQPRARQWLLRQVIKNRDFERLIFESGQKSLPIMITLDSNKVYVGWAVANPDPSMERKYLRILPLVSGYRTAETQKVEFTTFYDHIIEAIEIEAIENDEDSQLRSSKVEDIEVVLPVERIVSAHFFDLTVYNMFLTVSEAGSGKS